ncbi:MAG: FecR family protein [Pedobacter sp.]|uniref:FecR family protein n=1 Tax=Pedobacter sp. TaxID=1411316 RepID=UPI0033996255
MENERFIQLLTLKIVNELTDAEREELKDIISKNPELRHRKEILNKFWNRKRVSSRDNMAMFNKLMAQIEADEILNGHRPSPSNDEPVVLFRPYLKYWYSAAAVILISISIFTFYSKFFPFHSQELSVKWLKKTTRPTFRETIRLADGTVVTLNSATTFKYPKRFSGDTREVYLNGEAYFDVHKDSRHPFIIHANKMNVRVLGTAFNVKSYINEPLSETTLIRGSVEVTLNDRPSDRIILKPSEKLIVKNNTGALDKPELKNVPSLGENSSRSTNYALTSLTHYPNTDKTIIETSWVQNKLVFSDKNFVELSLQLERWYGIPFVFVNDRMKTERFSGIFERETLAEALDALKIVTPFKYRITKSKVFIY